jgi:hypothetical protein
MLVGGIDILSPDIVSDTLSELYFNEARNDLYIGGARLPASAYKAIKYLINTGLISPYKSKGILLIIAAMGRDDVFKKLFKDFNDDKLVIIDLLNIVFRDTNLDILDIILSDSTQQALNYAILVFTNAYNPLGVNERVMRKLLTSDRISKEYKDGLIVNQARAGRFSQEDLELYGSVDPRLILV